MMRCYSHHHRFEEMLILGIYRAHEPAVSPYDNVLRGLLIGNNGGNRPEHFPFVDDRSVRRRFNQGRPDEIAFAWNLRWLENLRTLT